MAAVGQRSVAPATVAALAAESAGPQKHEIPHSGESDHDASADDRFMTAWLVHFPHSPDPQVVMDFSGMEPTRGQLVIAGWVVDRSAPPGPDTQGDYALEVWVRPIAA
jgi:hypothetical protein